MKRAQMEIMGLVVIVILVTLGLLFVAQFSLTPDQDKKIFTRKELAASTMNALLRTTVPAERCGGNVGEVYSLGNEILSECHSGFPTFVCDGESPCQFLHDTYTDLLTKTLGAWNKKYELTIVEYGREDGFVINEGACDQAREIDSSDTFPITLLHGSVVQGELKLCD